MLNMMNELINGMQYNVKVKHYAPYPDAPETVTYTGQVVKSANYDPPDTIRMTTGIKDFPFRVIQRERIVAVNDRTFCYQSQRANDSMRMVKGSNGNEYTVTTSNGRTTCSCPGFQFRKTCKHIAN